MPSERGHENGGRGVSSIYLPKLLLPVGPHQNAVDAAFLVELGREQGQQVHLRVAVVAPREDDVFEDGLGIDVEALGDLAQAVGAAACGDDRGGRHSKRVSRGEESDHPRLEPDLQGALGVDVGHLLTIRPREQSECRLIFDVELSIGGLCRIRPCRWRRPC